MVKQKIINLKQELSIRQIERMILSDDFYCKQLKDIGMINHGK